MFGNLGAFVNGNMFMGLLGADVGVKLPDEYRARLLAEPRTGPFGPEERPMAGYFTLPAGWSARQAEPWVATAHAAAAALRPRSPGRGAAPRESAPDRAADRRAASIRATGGGIAAGMWTQTAASSDAVRRGSRPESVSVASAAPPV